MIDFLFQFLNLFYRYMVTGCLGWPPTCRIWILVSGIFIFQVWEYSAMHIPIWYDIWGVVENQFMMLLCLSKYVLYILSVVWSWTKNDFTFWVLLCLSPFFIDCLELYYYAENPCPSLQDRLLGLASKFKIERDVDLIFVEALSIFFRCSWLFIS